MNAFLQKAIQSEPTLQSTASKKVLERLDAHPNALFDDFDSVGKSILGTLMPFIYTELNVEDYYNPYEESGLIQRKTAPAFGLNAFMYMKGDQLKGVDEDFMHDFNTIEKSTDWRHRALKTVEARVVVPNIFYSNYVSVLSNWYYSTAFNGSNGVEMIVALNSAIISILLMDYSKFRAALYANVLDQMSRANDLQATQVISSVTFADIDNPTVEEACEFVKMLVDLKAAMKFRPAKFNEKDFNKTIKNLKFYTRPGFRERLIIALKGVYNPEYISNLFVDMIELPTLGKIKTCVDENGTKTTVYPVYSTDSRNRGQVIGFARTEGGEKEFEVTEAEMIDDDDDLYMIAVEENRVVYQIGTEGEYTMPVGSYNYSGSFYNQFLMVQGCEDGSTGAALYHDKTKCYIKFTNG